MSNETKFSISTPYGGVKEHCKSGRKKEKMKKMNKRRERVLAIWKANKNILHQSSDPAYFHPAHSFLLHFNEQQPHEMYTRRFDHFPMLNLLTKYFSPPSSWILEGTFPTELPASQEATTEQRTSQPLTTQAAIHFSPLAAVTTNQYFTQVDSLGRKFEFTQSHTSK